MYQSQFPRSVLFALVVAGCNTLLPGSGPTALDITFSNLVAIDKAKGHYEGWIAGPDTGASSLGKFLLAADGKPTTLDGAPKNSWQADIAPGRVSQVFFTVEKPGDTDSVPSRQVFLRGSIVPGTTVSLAPPLDLAILKAKAGKYLLLNPISKDPADWNGIWFEKLVGGVYSTGLELDESPSGWMYAGWVILGDTVLRTGKFQRADQMDDWAGYSGLNSVSLPVDFPGPPAPGEDFNKNLPAGVATGPNQPDLAGARVVVSLESATLNGEETYPSPVRIFEGEVPTPSAMNVTYDLANVVATKVPSVAVTLK